MILYYAMGGGLGHLTRARALLHTLGLTHAARVLTASDYADDRRVTGDLRVIKAPAALALDLPAYRLWLMRLLARLRPTALYLDTFPAGICGELCDFPPVTDLPVHYVARLLQWPAYEGLLAGRRPPRFAATHVLEPLAPAHAAFVARQSVKHAPLTLVDPPHPDDAAARGRFALLTRAAGPVWLIAHSAPAAEVAELLAYAEELRRLEQPGAQLILLARDVPPALPAHILHFDCYPAAPLFARAARVVSACGFNVMREMRRHRAKHRFMPFPRRFDDQFARAARALHEHP